MCITEHKVRVSPDGWRMQQQCTLRAGSRQPCRTWDRGDLLRRLHTFKAVTWFCKPDGAGPVDCARRGWVNVAEDALACEVQLPRLHALQGSQQRAFQLHAGRPLYEACRCSQHDLPYD